MEEKRIGVGVGVMILKGGKVLLGKRTKTSNLLKGAGTWSMPGGKLRFGETFEEGAKRETFEETGIKLIRAKVICVNNDKIDTAHFVTIGLLAEKFEGEPQVKEPDKITRWCWFDLGDLPTPLYFPTARVLENYQRKKFYLPH